MEPALRLKVGSIVEIDRSHLPVASKLPVTARRFAGKVLVNTYDGGWNFIQVHSAKANLAIAVAIPPAGMKHEEGRGPKVRLIR